ncbi:hypothetical protein AVEN_36298-1 [Araneus ventricosus]|uniref:Uncharacterized protein n=1 Tax=Araneus ventricosus TaxID=182803 RepID=A0A4Y2P3M5_ARAVE|nr:hypothetical protein AVEN_36298-1 [Araneus ventricosus]
MDNEGLFANIQEKHVAQVTGHNTSLQISNTYSQQNTNTDSTALSIALSSPADQLSMQTKLQSRSNRSTHSTQYLSVSNSLLVRTADRTPKRDSKDVSTPRRSQSINTFKLDQHSLLP